MEQFDELRGQLKRLMPTNGNHAVIIPPTYKLAVSLCKALEQAESLQKDLKRAIDERDLWRMINRVRKQNASLLVEIQKDVDRVYEENAALRTELHELEQAVLMATIERAVQTGEMQP
jgi:prephenate dehydrogenase